MLEAPSDPVLDGEVSDLMDLMEARPHGIAIDTFNRDDRGMLTGPYAPHVKIGDPGIPGAIDKLADFLFEMAFVGVEQNARRVTHKRRPMAKSRENGVTRVVITR
jgi:hypothetical protein